MTSFLEFARVAGNIRATSSKNEKVSILSGFLAQLNEEELPLVCRYFSGYLFPRWTEKEVFAGYSLLWNMVAELCSMNPRDLGEVYRKYGDLGDVAEEVLEKKVVQPLFKRQLSVTNVQQTFDNMSKMAGKGSQEGRRQTLKG